MKDDEEFRRKCREIVRRTRAEQGLPPKVTDPYVLGIVVDCILKAEERAARRRAKEAQGED